MVVVISHKAEALDRALADRNYYQRLLHKSAAFDPAQGRPDPYRLDFKKSRVEKDGAPVGSVGSRPALDILASERIWMPDYSLPNIIGERTFPSNDGGKGGDRGASG